MLPAVRVEDMTGDHHGRTARRATLLVTATDEILGTHSDFQAGEEQDRQPARNSPASPQRNPHEQRCDVNADEIGVFEPMTQPRIEGSSAGPSAAASSTNTGQAA